MFRDTAGVSGYEVEVKDRKDYVCDCVGICGVGKTHDELWKQFSARHGDTPYTREIEAKYRHWGKVYWR